MKVLKDDKYMAILNAARDEFMTRGYKEASMRTIAQKAGVGLSNIYNYFMNKDDIYLAIVKPARDEIFRFITEQHTEEHINYNTIATFGHNEEAVEYYIDLIDKYKAELHLLLYRSEGSSMSNFRDKFTDHLSQISCDYMEIEKKLYPQSRKISYFFIHAISSWMVSVVGEIITHDIERKEMREFFREYFQFEFAGWRALAGI